MKNMKRSVALLVAIALLIGCAAGGTMAWLMDETDAVTNTFVAGDITITLKESPLNNDGTYGTAAENVTNQYAMIPGKEYKKNPVVTVEAGSEDCWLFVKFEELNNPSTYLTYTSTLTETNDWTQGTGTIPSNVWYRKVMSDDPVKQWALLSDNKITVKGDAVTKENMATAATAKLTYTAYAHQLYNNTTEFSAAEAWAALNS